MQDQALTTEERHQLLSVLREFDHEAPTEQRTHARRKVEVRTTIRITEKHLASLKAIIMNVSIRGVGLLVDRPLPKKSRFLIPLRFNDGGGWLVLCEVRNCVTQPGGQWKVGARFLDHIDDPRGASSPPMDWLL